MSKGTTQDGGQVAGEDEWRAAHPLDASKWVVVLVGAGGCVELGGGGGWGRDCAPR